MINFAVPPWKTAELSAPFNNGGFPNRELNMMSSIRTTKEQQHAITLEHARAEDIRGLTQVLMTLALLALVWWAALLSVNVSLWLTAASILLISLFSVRVFALMHECGHGSLFRTQRLNRTFGFLLGVVSGMPQYVWSQHHSYFE